MLKNKLGRLVFVLVVLFALFAIGRNLYKRYVNSQLVGAVQARNVNAVRFFLDRGADANSKITITRHGDRASSSPMDDQHDELLIDYVLTSDNLKVQKEQIAALLIQHGAGIADIFTGACRAGRIEFARLLLASCPDRIKTGLNESNTPMYDAIRFYNSTENKSSPVTRSNEAPADRNFTAAEHKIIGKQLIALLRANGILYTPWNAAALGDQDTIKTALAHGLPIDSLPSGKPNHPNFSSEARFTLLVEAVNAGQTDTVKMLLQHGADLNNNYGVLSAAISQHKLDIVDLLIVHRPTLDVRDLDAAIQQGGMDIVHLLIAHGAVLSLQPTPGAAARLEYTHLLYHLLYTVFRSAPSLLPKLVAAGADVNAEDGQPLRIAIQSHNLQSIRFLLRHGARVKPAPSHAARGSVPSLHPASQQSLLMLALEEFPACFDLLLQAGADITPDRPTILLKAAELGHAELFPRLLALGADVNATDSRSETVLTYAIAHGSAGVKTLLEHGANPNVVTQNRQTPLTIAAQAGSLECVRLLLTHGAIVDHTPSRSRSALYYARKHHFAAISALLEKAGVKE